MESYHAAIKRELASTQQTASGALRKVPEHLRARPQFDS